MLPSDQLQGCEPYAQAKRRRVTLPGSWRSDRLGRYRRYRRYCRTVTDFTRVTLQLACDQASLVPTGESWRTPSRLGNAV